MTIDDEIAKLDKEYPLTPHTNAGRLYTTVRRMKAEKERGIPIERRSGFAISTVTSQAANQMREQEWESFYGRLSDQLKADYPDSYVALFPEGREISEETLARKENKS